MKLLNWALICACADDLLQLAADVVREAVKAVLVHILY